MDTSFKQGSNAAVSHKEQINDKKKKKLKKKKKKKRESYWSQNCQGIEGVSIVQKLPAKKCL